MNSRGKIIFVCVLVFVLCSLVAHAATPLIRERKNHVLGNFEMSGYISTGVGWQRFSDEPTTEYTFGGNYGGIIGPWLGASVVPTSGPPSPGENIFQFFIKNIELDLSNDFTDNFSFVADLRFGRADSGSDSLVGLWHAYIMWRIMEEYNLILTLGRYGTQDGFEPSWTYLNDTISWSIIWTTLIAPGTNTGIQLSADFSDNFSFYFSVCNGVVNDTVDKKGNVPSFLSSFIIKWGEHQENNIVLTPYFGAESNSNRHFLYGFDAVLAWWFEEDWQLGLEGSYQRNNAISSAFDNTDYAAGLFNLRWNFINTAYAVLKYTYAQQFGIGNGVLNLTGAKQQIHEASVGLGYFLADNAKLKWEFRNDFILPAGQANQWIVGTALGLDYAF